MTTMHWSSVATVNLSVHTAKDAITVQCNNKLRQYLDYRSKIYLGVIKMSEIIYIVLQKYIYLNYKILVL